VIRTRISGHGFYVPENTVTNFDLEKVMDTSDTWIQERSGISERHFASEEDGGASGMAVKAAEQALAAAGMVKEDIDCIIAATLSPDYFIPGIGVIIQRKMELGHIPAYDIRQQCSGFVYGLEMADALIKSGKYRHILLVGSELQSTGLDLSTRGRDTAVLFGDGAGAFILSASESGDSDIIDSVLHSDGEYMDLLWIESPSSLKKGRISTEDIEAGRTFPSMNGKVVFKNATTRMPQVVREVLERNQLALEDVKLVIPHQANARITEMVARMLRLPSETVYSNIHRYGNTTAATIPIAFTEALSEGLFQRGDLIVTVSFGSGFTWGANIIRY